MQVIPPLTVERLARVWDYAREYLRAERLDGLNPGRDHVDYDAETGIALGPPLGRPTALAISVAQQLQ
jgi:hypothetical protein